MLLPRLFHRVNVPSERKMDDPRYGTEPPENIPTLTYGSEIMDTPSVVRVLAGELKGQTGPFKTVQEVQILDFNLPAVATVEHAVPEHMDNCLIYVFQGSMEVAGKKVGTHQVARLDASPGQPRSFTVQAAANEGARFLVFAGKMLKQPIAWHGPFVMTTQAEVQQTLKEYSQGTFLKIRTAWDYKRIATKPKDE
jgi:redox-sensitive bicupin YhaK (pirin superfamily)